jgi:pyruvate/2-oxoglutarate dehydrogenase complex dihydrolipoamide acyltransferase (E2) component
MSHTEIIPTVKIKSSDPKTQGDFIEINQSDYDSKKHELYEESDVPAPKPVKAAKINATPEAIAFAEEAAFDLTGVKGSGKKGLITIEDVQDAIEALEESE